MGTAITASGPSRLSVAYLRRRLSLELERVQSWGARANLWLNEDQKRLLKLRNLYAGRRGFVIGNGPSLRIDDLSTLHEREEISIGSNKIFLVFAKTDWRPTYYTVDDRIVAENNCVTLRRLNLVKIFARNLEPILGRPAEPRDHGEHIYFRSLSCRHSRPERYRPLCSDDPLRGFFVGQTITNLNIQIANFLGCNPIYLIGLDGRYIVPSQRVPHEEYGEVAVSEGEVNHFDPAYHTVGETWSIPRPELHEIEFAVARRFLESRGVAILNASRWTAVHAFDRVDLEEILRFS